MRVALTRSLHDEEGSGTLTSLAILLICLLLGGAAIDYGNALRVNEILQSNAEAAAISAAVRASEPLITESPRQVARRIARTGLEAAGIPDAWHPQSFEWGGYDPETDDFIPVPGLAPGRAHDAVRVTLNRDAAHGNGEPQLFIWLFGHAPWNLQGQAVARIRTQPALDCPDPLLSLQARVDVSEINAFLGICLYANAYAEYGEMPLWVTPDTEALIGTMVAQALALPQPDLFGVSLPPRRGDLARVVAEATRHISLHDLDNISVVSGGSVFVDCDENEVLRLGDGFVIENAALYSECPIRFDGEVRLEASLVIGNLTSVLTDLGEVRVTPDALLTGSPDCAPGSGVQVLLYADLDIIAGIPALISTASPVGRYIDDTVGLVGEVLGGAQNLIGGILNPLVEDISEVTTDLALLPICLNARTMLNSDTVVLR